jgi:hypothetical protein
VRVSSSAQGSSSGSSNSGGNNSGGNNSMPSKSATLGQSCSVKNEKGAIPNGTAICEEVNGKLIWQRWMPQGETSDQGSSGGNNSNDSNRVTLGTSCSKKGDSGSSASGTLVCALSAGKLTWVEIRKQPIPSDGVWIFGPIGEFKYGPTLKQQSTADWNTDLPPDGWEGEPDWFGGNWDVPTTTPLAPKCSSNTPLTNYIADLDAIESITPQGFMQPGVHAMPVAHMYYNTGVSTEKDPNNVPYRSKITNVYAPADMTLYGAAKLENTMADGYKYSEWMMAWHFCGTYWMFTAHLDSLPAPMLAAINAAPVKQCQQGGQLNNTSEDCFYYRFAYKAKAGSVIGKASGRAHGFDFGFTDASAPIATRINPRAYSPRWAAGLCHINFYPASMRAKLEAKLIGTNGCGQLVSDVAGTAQGEWLATGPNKHSSMEDYHLALAKHWSDRELLAFSFGWNSEVPGISGGVFTFKPNSAGPNNKAFTDVKNGQVMCYDNLQGKARDGSEPPTIYIRMTAGDTEKLTIAKGSGPCGAGPYTMPASSQTFERKVKS